jgi:hypothetical protein
LQERGVLMIVREVFVIGEGTVIELGVGIAFLRRSDLGQAGIHAKVMLHTLQLHVDTGKSIFAPCR